MSQGKRAPAGADPYGYDRATDSVRVSRHDLSRLLLMFRTELERGGHHRAWQHMADYDLSFERLADAADHATAIFYRGTRQAAGPDYRMRCKRSAVYDFGSRPPYEGRSARLLTMRVRGRGVHYVPPWRSSSGVAEALCRFSFAVGGPDGEGRVTEAAPDCAVCVRERALIEALGLGVIGDD